MLMQVPIVSKLRNQCAGANVHMFEHSVTSVKHGLCCMQGLLEGGSGCLQLTLQQPVAALQLPDQPISLHHTTSDITISPRP